MNRTLISFFLLLISMVSHAQKDSSSYAEGTEGEQEYNWAKEIFNKDSGKQSFQEFKGKIVIIDKNTIKYDGKVIHVFDTSSELLSIFKRGILYPSIILGNQPYHDTLVICCIEEVKFPKQSVKTKRFSLLLADNSVNPALYFFELTNENATEETDRACFIDGAKLTVFGFASILM
jgi:hypothetical protein